MSKQFAQPQLLRYGRQIVLPQINLQGQERLADAKVLLLGVGGLGCVVAQYLAAAGVGKLVLLDNDRVDLSNLQRQILFDQSQLGEPKVLAAQHRLLQLNDEVIIDTVFQHSTEARLEELVQKVDIVIDGTDNFESRFLHNRICVQQKRTLISGAAIRFEGQITVFPFELRPSPCYQCVFSPSATTDQSCVANGVLGPVVGTIGALMATEAIKHLTACGDTLDSRLLLYDALKVQWREVKIKRDKECPICQSSSN